MPERKRTEAVTAREEPAAPQKTCMGCESWDKFSCFNAESRFFGGLVDCGCRFYKREAKEK